jgi:uncharacterized membrane protein
MMKLGTLIFGYFLRGLLVVVPTAVTVYVVVRLFQFIDGLLARALGSYLPKYGVLPGLGIVVLVLLITLLGVFASSVIAQPLQRAAGRALDKVPLVKTLYSAIKDLLSAFVGTEKRFDQPVLVKLGKELGVERIGFITKPDLAELGLVDNKVAVYLPHAYAWSGNLVIVPREQLTPLAVKPAEAMKFIVSGGVSAVQVKEIRSRREQN